MEIAVAATSPRYLLSMMLSSLRPYSHILGLLLSYSSAATSLVCGSR